MLTELSIVAGTAALIGVAHTAMGPDHYLPFVALARSGKWSAFKTALITGLCGLGHVFSSVVLGLIGVGLGSAVFKLKAIESWRGHVAAWLLIAFGFCYLVWGLWRALRNRPHTHPHVHADGSRHQHGHTHANQHVHPHGEAANSSSPWILFVIFVFGPCEPLIPLVMYPAGRGDIPGTVTICVVFSVATVVTMLTIVFLSLFGLSRLKLPGLDRYSHALAGLAILLCGGTIKVLGL